MIYAGLDVDGVAKLFAIRDDIPVPIRQFDWIKILDEIGEESGVMLLVSFQPSMAAPSDAARGSA